MGISGYTNKVWAKKRYNVRPGLERRTEILHKLEKSSATAKGLSGEISVTYSTILHHLHNLEDRGIIERVSTNPPFTWKAKPVGQQRLIQ
jgi:predicted ArsR family transcriptional regulator